MAVNSQQQSTVSQQTVKFDIRRRKNKTPHDYYNNNDSQGGAWSIEWVVQHRKQQQANPRELPWTWTCTWIIPMPMPSSTFRRRLPFPSDLFWCTRMVDMICYVVLCYAMLCYAVLCYAMLCYVMEAFCEMWFVLTSLKMKGLLKTRNS